MDTLSRSHSQSFTTKFSSFFRKSALTALLCLTASSAVFAQTAFDDPALRSQRGSGTLGGTLVPVETDVDGGTLQIGNSAQVVMRFRNESTEEITFKETRTKNTEKI